MGTLCIRIPVLILGVLLLFLAGGVEPCYPISFHFAPAVFNFEARPGQTVNAVFTLTLAKDSSPSHFQVRIEDWWRSADNNQTFYASPGTVRRSCGPWCTANPTETDVKPGETMSVRLTVRVPDQVEPGGYWAALTVNEVADPLSVKPDGVAMVFRGSLSVGIFVEISPTTRAARITGVRIADDRVAVTLRNDGNTPLRPTGNFEFYRADEAKPVATTAIGGEPLLPEPVNTCEFGSDLPDRKILPPGKYRVRVIVDVGLDHLLGAEKELEILRPEVS